MFHDIRVNLDIPQDLVLVDEAGKANFGCVWNSSQDNPCLGRERRPFGYASHYCCNCKSYLTIRALEDIIKIDVQAFREYMKILQISAGEC
jgi:hypothetical protein